MDRPPGALPNRYEDWLAPGADGVIQIGDESLGTPVDVDVPESLGG